MRLRLLDRYVELQSPPVIRLDLESSIGFALPKTNDFVDNHLLAAIHGHAVSYLVTEDRGIHRKARRAGLSSKVLFLNEAIGILEALFDKTPKPPPAVENVLAHELDERDPIFASFREDYEHFDIWLAKCKQEHRQAWIIKSAQGYSGFAIVNPESSPPTILSGKVLKICSFKIAEHSHGRKYGELLLKTIFEYARINNYDYLFVTVFEKHIQLFDLFADFGFDESGQMTSLGEKELWKPMRAPEKTLLSGIEFNIKYGPHLVDWSQPNFVIPIQPVYDEMLFPDRLEQQSLFSGGTSFGNAIRKAYLCHSKTHRLTPGSVLWFYRSSDVQGIVACGVLEHWLRNDDAQIIAEFVARRTVYSYDEIVQMCKKSVLAILFRQAILLPSPIRLSELKGSGTLNGPPQSIVSIDARKATWIWNQL